MAEGGKADKSLIISKTAMLKGTQRDVNLEMRKNAVISISSRMMQAVRMVLMREISGQFGKPTADLLKVFLVMVLIGKQTKLARLIGILAATLSNARSPKYHFEAAETRLLELQSKMHPARCWRQTRARLMRLPCELNSDQ